MAIAKIFEHFVDFDVSNELCTASNSTIDFPTMRYVVVGDIDTISKCPNSKCNKEEIPVEIVSRSTLS